MIPHSNIPERVLMICPQFRPLIGGYERAAERLSQALAVCGMKVVVITEQRDRRWPVVEQMDGYEIRRLFCLYYRHLHVLTSMLSFAGFLLVQGRKFDVWHVHQYGLHAALAVVLGKLLRRPIILKLTSSANMGISQALGQGIWGKLLAALHRQVDVCLAVSEETQREAMQFGISESRIHLVPNGVDGCQFHPVSPEGRAAARQVLQLNCQHLALFVGRLSPEKNPLGLLDAWGSLSTQVRAKALLVLVGDGPERERLHARIRELGLDNSVLLAGKRNDVEIWYQAADIYVIPSFREGLSNSMLEALASGLPVISTRVSGSSVLLESPIAGLVIDVGAASQIADALERLLGDEYIRTELGKNARRIFESYFSLDILVNHLLMIYQQLVNKRIMQDSI